MYLTTYGFPSERPGPLPTPASTLTPSSTRRRSTWLLSFTGLLPVLLSVPLVLLGLWVPALVVGLLTNLAVIAYHLRRGQGVSSLDAVSLAFNATNVVLFFGFGIAVLLEHLDACVYALLVAQVAWGFVRGVPWTIQFARRSTPAALWQTPEFLAANKVTSTAWFAAFLASFVMAVLLPSGSVRFLLPVALIGLTAVFTPRIARRAINRPSVLSARGFERAADLVRSLPATYVPTVAPDLEATVQFHFVDEQPIDWYLRFTTGRCEAQPGCIDQPTVAVTTPGATWLAISSGALSGVQAFMAGSVRVEGDLGLLMRLPSLFSTSGLALASSGPLEQPRAAQPVGAAA